MSVTPKPLYSPFSPKPLFLMIPLAWDSVLGVWRGKTAEQRKGGSKTLNATFTSSSKQKQGRLEEMIIMTKFHKLSTCQCVKTDFLTLPTGLKLETVIILTKHHTHRHRHRHTHTRTHTHTHTQRCA